jgi:hypothetical protein
VRPRVRRLEQKRSFSVNPFHDLSSALHSGEPFASDALGAGECAVEDGAKGFEGRLSEAAKVLKNMSPSDIGHTALDAVGMVPVVGSLAKLANAGWYAAQGDWTDAAWSAAAAIPIEGEVADAAKLGKDALTIGEDALKAGEAGAKVEHAVEDGTRISELVDKADGLPSPKGGRAIGEVSGRPFAPDLAGGPVEKLSAQGVQITNEGIDRLEQHIARFGPDDANQAMVARLRSIAQGDLAPTDYDVNFYTHELREFDRYTNLEWASGQPASADAAYELWNNAHTATLEDYGLKDGQLYHPDASK